jgi:hypothetical protein
MDGFGLQTYIEQNTTAGLRIDKPSNLRAVKFERRCAACVRDLEGAERKSGAQNRNRVRMLPEIRQRPCLQAGRGARLRQDADSNYGLIRSDAPIRSGFAGCSEERS